MGYLKGQPCGKCGSELAEVIQFIGYNFASCRYTCPKCNSVEAVTFQCEICGTKNEYLTFSNRKVQDYCNHCRQEEINQRQGSKGPAVKKIPSWRLHIDDMADGEVLEHKGQVPGMPLKSANEWKEYYNQPHEKEKQREYKKKREELARELLG